MADTACAETFKAGSWPLEVSVTPEQPAIMLGEPSSLLFTVKNLSDEDLQIIEGGDYRNALGRPETFKVRVVRSDEKAVTQPGAGMSMGGMVAPKSLPAKDSYVFKLFLPHWATFDEAGRYMVTCERTLQLIKPVAGTSWSELKTTDVNVVVKTTIEVTPRDETRMGALIAKLGERMLTSVSSDESENATRALAAIEDARVVPLFRQALNSKSYGLKFSALGVLAKFNSDEAFEGLKAGMATKSSDFDPASATRPELLDQLANNIRNTAAAALCRSKHPGASAFLLVHRHDEYEGVRITVLHLLGTMPPNEALPILREMSEDKSKMVSDEAKRYIELLSKPKNP